MAPVRRWRPILTLKVRYRNETEVPDWRDGLVLSDAIVQAEAAGWQLFDREPGNAPGEYAILHFIRRR